ncbi:MAG: hypothetical protein ACC667_05825, partial [Longimicrobiales bacterium]
HYRHEGELARGYLHDAGVESILFMDDAGGADSGLTFVSPGRLVVRLEDEEQAVELLHDLGFLEGEQKA